MSLGTRVGLGVAIALLAASAAWAHHNMSALFDFNDRVTLNGSLSKIDWRNPHIYLAVDVKSGSEQGQTWSVEGPAPNFFRTRDITKADFEGALGKEVVVEHLLSGDRFVACRPPPSALPISELNGSKSGRSRRRFGEEYVRSAAMPTRKRAQP